MFDRVLAELAECGGSGGGWAFIGSAAMAAAGLMVEPGDVDIFVRPWLWEVMGRRGWREEYPNPEHPPMMTWHDGERPVSAWWEWHHDSRWRIEEPTVGEVLDDARRLANGVWIMNLETLGVWKNELLAHPGTGHRKAKDLRHLALLTEAGYWSPPAAELA